MRNIIKEHFEAAANEYAKLFCEKHDIEFKDTYWVQHDVGGQLLLDDDFRCVNMDDLRYDIDTDQPKGQWEAYWDYCMRVGAFNGQWCNYPSWCKGCPRYSEEEMQKIEQAQRDVEYAKQALKDLMEKYKQEKEL